MHSGEHNETPSAGGDAATEPATSLCTVVGGVATTGLGVALLTLAGLGLAMVAVLAAERRRREVAARVAALMAANHTLEERRVRKDEFLAGVSHELRTPLNVVLGYVDLLLDESFGALKPAQRDILHRVTNNASNLSHLINDLVDLSRIEANRLQVEMQTVDLEPLFAEFRSVMDVLLAGREVAFRAEIGPGCARVHADPDRLKQIVSNLLVNAVKFTERGSIALSAAGIHGRIEIVVADTGIGIPRTHHQAIFEPFRQVHDRARRTPGAGIGLSISARLALLMNGSLRVASTPGHGSRFTLVLEPAPTSPARSADRHRAS